MQDTSGHRSPLDVDRSHTLDMSSPRESRRFEVIPRSRFNLKTYTASAYMSGLPPTRVGESRRILRILQEALVVSFAYSPSCHAYSECGFDSERLFLSVDA